MNYSLVRAVLDGTWSVSLPAFLQYQHIANAIMNGQKFEFEAEKKEDQTFFINPLSGYDSRKSANSEEKQEDLIAIHSVVGIMLKYNTFCGPIGTKTIANRFSQADNDPSVVAHVVIFDTGGGQTSSIPPLTSVFEKTKKPIVAFVDGTMASAGLYAGVFCNEIIASSPGDIIGSIGTFISFNAPKKNSVDKDGNVNVRIYATTSGKKNIEFEQAIEGEYELIQKNILDPHDKDFMDDVRSRRPNVTDEQLEGGIFQARNLKRTLIDSIGDLDFAISRAAELADKNKNSNSNNNSNSNTMNKQEFNRLAVAAGLKSFEIQDNGIFLTVDQANAVESVLEKNENTINAYSGLKDGESIQGLRDQITSKTAENKTLSDDNKRLKTENEDLSKETVGKTGADAADDDKKKKSSDPQAEHFYELSQIK